MTNAIASPAPQRSPQDFYGQRGEARKCYCERQEDQLGALGLVVNSVALCNSFYLDRDIEQLREQGEEMREEDL